MHYNNKRVFLPKYRLVLSFIWFYFGYAFCSWENLDYINWFTFLGFWVAITVGIYVMEIIIHAIANSAKKYKKENE